MAVTVGMDIPWPIPMYGTRQSLMSIPPGAMARRERSNLRFRPVPVVSTLMTGDTVYIEITGFNGRYPVVTATSSYIEIDLTEKGGSYVQDIEVSSLDKVTELHGYDEPEWQLEPCRNWHFALQSKDSTTTENIGSYSHFEKVQPPEKWPWEMYSGSNS